MISKENSGITQPAGQGALLQPERFARWAWIWAYAAIVTTMAVVRYSLFVTHGFSLSGYLTAFSLIMQGRAADLAANSLTAFLFHQQAWGLWVLAPLAQNLGIAFLFFLSAMVIGSGGLALYGIGRIWGRSSRTAAAVSSLYLLYPPLIAANVYDFHLTIWAVPLILWLVWFAVRGRWLGFGILLLIGTGLGISVTGALVLTGIGLLLRREVWRFGLAAVLFALAYWSLIHRGLVIPAWTWQGHLSLRVGLYLLWVILPLLAAIAGVIIRKRNNILNGWWIPTAAIVVFNIARGTVSDTSPFTDHSALIGPFFALAILATGELGAKLGKVALIWSLGWVVLMGGYLYHSTWRPRPANVAELSLALAKVPPGAFLVSQSYILPHRGVTDRDFPTTALFGVPIPAGTYVLLNPKVSDGYSSSAVLTQWLNIAKSPGKSRLLYHKAGIWLFVLNHSALPSGDKAMTGG
ncbi:MAG: DUF2079 domain-containing protein [Sulfobacillus sp.]